MAIYAITGRPRHGKTYYLASLVPLWLRDGRRVYSNIKFNLGVGALKKFDESILGNVYNKADLDDPTKLLFYWRNIHDWNHFSRGVIIADEGTRYFNPRQWSLLSEETEIKLQQHGKEDLDIWLTTQHYSRLDITLRLLVERFMVVKMVFGNPNNLRSIFPRLCKLTEHYLEDMIRMDNMGRDPHDSEEIYSEYFFIRKKYSQIYDTRAMVGRSDLMPPVHRERVCTICGKTLVTHL